MKKCIFIQLLCAVLFCGFQVSNSWAIGLGLYANTGSGSAHWESEDQWGYTNDWDKDTEHDGFGFVLDTAVARDRVFNYRLSFGQENWDHKPGDGRTTAELDGYVIENDFGFGVLRQPLGGSGSLRLWVGPELRISYSQGESNLNRDWKFDLWCVSLGPVVGLNLNFGPVFTLGIKTGYLSGFFFGEGGYSSYWENYTGTESHYFLSLAIIFRINDALEW